MPQRPHDAFASESSPDSDLATLELGTAELEVRPAAMLGKTASFRITQTEGLSRTIALLMLNS